MIIPIVLASIVILGGYYIDKTVWIFLRIHKALAWTLNNGIFLITVPFVFVGRIIHGSEKMHEFLDRAKER